MQVSSYIFQSPYSQPLQVGRPDPVAVKENSENAQKELREQTKESTKLLQNTSQTEPLDAPIKSSTLYRSDPSFSQTAQSLKEYQSASQEVQRSQNITAYVKSSNELLA